MIEEGKYCSDVMTKHFSKELTMAKKDNEDIEKYTKCWVCDNDYTDVKVKVKDHFHITGKYWGSGHRGFNINVKLNHKNFCRTSQPKKIWFTSYYAKIR